MAVKIDELSLLANPQLTGLVPVVVGGATRKTTLQDILGAVTGGTVTSLNFSGNLAANPNPITTSGDIYFNLPGMILPYAGTSAPSGWVFCNGQELNRVGNAALFGVIQTTYGSGNGTTTFNVPDLRGRIPFGKANSSTETNKLSGQAISPNIYTLGATGGYESHTLTTEQTSVRGHSHNGATKKAVYGRSNEAADWNCPPPMGSYCGNNMSGNIVEGVYTVGNLNGYPTCHFELTARTLDSDTNPYVQALLEESPWKRSQTITWTQAFGDLTFPVSPISLSTPTASSNLSVGLRVNSGSAYISSNTLYITGPGWIVLEAFQDGNSTFLPVVLAKSFYVTSAPHNNMPPCQVVNYIIKT